MKDGMNRREALVAAALTTTAAAMPAAGQAGDARTGQLVKVPRETKSVTINAATNLCAVPSPDGTVLALDFAGVIWTVPIGGGAARPMTGLLGDSSLPDWTPDGRAIVFQRYASGNFQLWRLDLATMEERQLTTGAFDCREPAVSPDGKSVAYVSDRTGRCRLFVLDLATLTSEEWTDAPGEAAQPCWSPDGLKLVSISDGRRIFVTSRSGAVNEVAAVPPSHGPLTRSLLAGPAFDGEDVCAVEVLGAKARLRDLAGHSLTEGEDVFPFRPHRLPDGSLIYTADGQVMQKAQGAAAAVAVPVSFLLPVATRRRQRTVRKNAPANPQPVRGIGSPAISPDATRIAFRALNRLWIMPVGGRPEAVVTDGYCVTDPAWSPDGRQLAYASDRGGTFDIWLRDMATGEERQLTRYDGAAQAPAWSPAGDRIAFIDQRGALYVCDIGPGKVRKVLDPLFMPGKPSWGPDGRKIAFAALVPSSARFREGTNRILVVDVASGKAVYQPLVGGSIATRGDDGPVWSPDGRRMVFVIASRLWVCEVTPDGAVAGTPRPITDEVSDVICPLLSGPISILGMATKEEWNGKEAQAGRHHRQAA